ncbi:hypothetical protein [Streptomyces sp. NPDC090022]|uniref:hypothetical protein n=1 Tax=Streptomyces sp. NPDC090022 TaxID=3365920 RepID=UPI00381153D6
MRLRARWNRATLYRWIRDERRLGLVLVAVGLPITCLGAAMYVLAGPGFAALVIGLSLFFTGVAMALAGQDGDR